MLKIVQVLNNNAILVKDSQGEESIVTGLGIAFKKSKGDLVAKNKIERQFILKNQESKENVMTLLKDVPLDFITTTYEMIDVLLKRYDYSVQEYIYGHL